MAHVVVGLSVTEIYNKIANHFNKSRHRIWGKVKRFMDSLEEGACVLELGCGNGKNMLYRRDLNIVGIDISEEQVRICKNKQLYVEKGCITHLNYDSCYFDHMICIAVYHHLDNDIDRQKCLLEMYRCLKMGGSALITVWAMEQPEDSTFHFTKKDEMVPWSSKDDGNTYLRYYHIYRVGELEEEILRLCPQFTITEVGWEVGNWHCVIQKVS